MTLSDHLLGPALALRALTALGMGSILAYNLILLGALVMSPLSLYWLLRRVGHGWDAAIVAALGWGFAAYRVAHVSHVQLLLALWIPPLVWSFDRLLERPSGARAALFTLFYWLHLSGGNYLAYMAHFFLLAICIRRWRETAAALRDLPRVAWLLIAAGACCLAVAAIYLPYVHYGKMLGVARGPQEWMKFGARWRYFLVAAEGTALARPALDKLRGAEQALFPGALTLFLAAVALVFGRRVSRTPLESALLGGSITSLALSFPLVFVALARWLPGLDSLRVPARFMQLAGVGLACLAAHGYRVMTRRLESMPLRAAIVGVALLLLALELLPSSARWSRLGEEAEFPQLDRWIAGRPEVTAYIDLPFPPRNRLTREGLAMYLSTLHWKKLVNGRSGYTPDTWWGLYRAIPVMPDEAALRRLRELGVSHIVVRDQRMREEKWRRDAYHDWMRDFDSGGFQDLEQVYKDDHDNLVLKIARAD